MPTFRITGPDGTVYRVNGPEGSTQEEALAQVQAQVGAKGGGTPGMGVAQTPATASGGTADARRAVSEAAARAYSASGAGADAGILEQLAGGGKHALDRAAMGLKGLFTDLTPEDKALLEQGQQFVERTGPASSIGEFAGDVAITAPIGGALMKGGQAVLGAAKRVPQLVRTLMAATGSGAATGALVSPEDRAGGATMGAVGGGLGEAGGRFLTKALSGPAAKLVSPEARAMMDEGITPPLWKATDNSIIRSLGERAKALPIVGSTMRNQERKAIEEWNRKMVGELTPPTPIMDDAGNILRWEPGRAAGEKIPVGAKAMEDLGGRFNKSYDALYEGRTVPMGDEWTNQLDDITRQVEAYTPSIAADIKGAAQRAKDTVLPGTEEVITKSNIVDEFGKPFEQVGGPRHSGVTYDAVRRARMDLDDAITAAWNSGDAEKARALDTIRKTLTDAQAKSLPPEVASMKGEIDKAYTGFKRLQRAGASLGAARNEGVASPGQLLNAARALDRTPGKSSFAKGSAPMQQEALAAERVLGSTLPETGPGTAEKMLFGMGAFMTPWMIPFGLAATRPGQKALMGGYGPQKAIDKHSEAIIALLRRGAIAASPQE